MECLHPKMLWFNCSGTGIFVHAFTCVQSYWNIVTVNALPLSCIQYMTNYNPTTLVNKLVISYSFNTRIQFPRYSTVWLLLHIKYGLLFIFETLVILLIEMSTVKSYNRSTPF